MVIRESSYIKETRTQMRGGTGDVLFGHIAQGTALPAKCRIFSQITLEPGASIGEHKHEKETEFYFILTGEGKVCDDGVDVVARAGDTVVTGDGHSHSITNSGKETLSFLAVIVLD